MKIKSADYLVLDQQTGKYREDAEQAVRDDVEKHAWRHIGLTIMKDWRLYLMLVPMLLVFLFWRYFPMYELLGAFKLKEEAVKEAFAAHPVWEVLETTYQGEWVSITARKRA